MGRLTEKGAKIDAIVFLDEPRRGEQHSALPLTRRRIRCWSILHCCERRQLLWPNLSMPVQMGSLTRSNSNLRIRSSTRTVHAYYTPRARSNCCGTALSLSRRQTKETKRSTPTSRLEIEIEGKAAPVVRSTYTKCESELPSSRRRLHTCNHPPG